MGKLDFSKTLTFITFFLLTLTRSTPILKRLHWLSVKFRIHFKICTITFQTLKDNQPAYLAYLLVRPKCSKYLRSTNSNRSVFLV